MLRETIEIICLLALTIGASGREYLAEKPEFFQTCLSQDPDFNACYRENIQALIRNFRDGIPGLQSVGKFEPVKIKKLSIVQNQLRIDMRNVTVRGLGSSIIMDARIRPQDFSFKLKVLIPAIHIAGMYKTFGQIMFLPINGNGKIALNAANISLTFYAKIKLHDDSNNTFADIQRIKTKIGDIGSFHVELENLFNGNKMLEDYTNSIFNENWRDLMEVMRPTLEESINAIVLDRFKKVFNYIPAKYLIADVPTEYELKKTV